LNHAEPTPRPGAKVIPRSDHSITRADISENALKVLYRLKKAGYAAFIVGGGVRDLLLGLHPKDFDVVTDALPEDVKRLFRNCRLVGRRFRLAHIRFGPEIIEVATFRASGNGGNEALEHHAESGRILRDNVYGTIEDDVWRRDFTANALYYNIADFSIWDFTSGLEDVRAKRLRLIGDPVKRYREDPVRMLRAVRFAAKLGFEIDATAARPIGELASLLRDVPSARLFEEVLKLFETGHAVRSFTLLEQYGLLDYVFPSAARELRGPNAEHVRAFIERGLGNTDQRVADDMPITPTFLYAVLLWPAIRTLSREITDREGLSPVQATAEASYRIAAAQQATTSLPKRFATPMHEMLQMQHRFENRRGTRAARLLEHKRFRAAYDFLLLRAACGEVDAELAAWWTDVQAGSNADQAQAFGLGGRKSRRRRGGRRRRRRSATGDAAP
jgi:poly(A) polymerase